MKLDKTNKTRPNVKHASEWSPTYQGHIHTARLIAYVAKRKNGVYRPIDRYVAWYCPDVREANEYLKEKADDKILEDMRNKISNGRYHDWFFA